MMDTPRCALHHRDGMCSTFFETKRRVEGGKGRRRGRGWWGRKGKGWIIRCLLHSAPSDTDATLSCLPCRPSAADSVIHNVRNEREWHLFLPRVLFPRKNFTSVSRRNFTRRSFDAQIALFTSQSSKNNYSEMYLDEISSRLAIYYFLADCNSLSHRWYRFRGGNSWIKVRVAQIQNKIILWKYCIGIENFWKF